MGSRRMLALAVVLALLPAPVRPSDWRTYDVRDYGAAGDGVQLDTPHIQAAIDAAVAAGGGLVLLPAAHSDSQARSAALTSQPLSAASADESQPTVYLSSGITVGSNVVLRIERGAVLGSSRRWADFNYTLVLATDCDPGPCLEWRRHPIVLFSSCAKPVNPGKAGMRCDEWTRVTNVTLDGGGEIHGEGDSWWNSEKYMGAAYQRPHILFPFFVTNLRVKDLTLLRSPWWTVHILACRDVVLSNLRIDAEVDYTSSIYPTNNVDGIDISSSQDVLVEHSFIKPGDDCVVIYALHPNEMVTRNITVRNTTCHTPFSIGNGDPGRMEYIEDVLFENCTVKGGLTPNDQRFKPRWWQTALRIKGNPGANVRVLPASLPHAASFPLLRYAGCRCIVLTTDHTTGVCAGDRPQRDVPRHPGRRRRSGVRPGHALRLPEHQWHGQLR